MRITIADVAVALEHEQDPQRRALLEELATVMFRVSITRWQTARLRSYLCSLTLDAAEKGGEDDSRDGAAA